MDPVLRKFCAMTQVVAAIQLSANPEAQTESFRSVILGRDAWVLELVESERALRKAAECQRDHPAFGLLSVKFGGLNTLPRGSLSPTSSAAKPAGAGRSL